MKKKENQAQISEDNDNRDIKLPNYTTDEQKYRGFIIDRLTSAKESREQTHTEYDDLTYTENYRTNKKAGISYNPPKNNKNDPRIVTGTTMEKENIILNTILNLNLEPDIEAFSKDDLPVQQLSEAVEAMVKKSRILEDYDGLKRELFYKELFDQGTAFAEELFVEPKHIQKELKDKNWFEKDVDKIEWTEVLKTGLGQCEINLIKGTKVFLGNINESLVSKQPYLYTVEYKPYYDAEKLYGKMKRWENVPTQVNQLDSKTEDDTEFANWRLYDTNEEMVEIIKYQDKWSNEYMLVINGVMMLPCGFPLSEMTGDGKYSLTKGDVERIPFFAYAKSIPAKTKVAQAVLDEFLRLMILKTQQSYKPPYANASNRILNSDIFNAGTITPNVAPDQLKPLVTHQGVSTGEVNAYQMLQAVLDDMTVSKQFEGTEDKKQTATESMNNMRQSLTKIGLYVLGVINWEREMCKRRIVNILKHWTEPIDKKITGVKGKVESMYRTISAPASFQGKQGIRMVKFTEDNTPNTPQSIMAEEDSYEGLTGKPVKITYLRADMIKNLNNEWYIEITPTEKETSEVRKAMFKQDIADTVALFGIESTNLEGLKPRWSQILKEEKDVLFTEGQQSISPMQQGQAGAGQRPQVPSVKTPQKPSINTLQNQA